MDGETSTFKFFSLSPSTQKPSFPFKHKSPDEILITPPDSKYIKLWHVANMDPCITFGWWCTNADELERVKTEFVDLLDTSCTFMSSTLEMTDVDEDDIVLVG